MKTLIIFMSVLSMTLSAACLYLTWELGNWTVNYLDYCQLTDRTHEQQQVLMGLQDDLCINVNDRLARLDPLESKVTEAEERLSVVEQNLNAAFEMLESQNK
jgi:hypothetical protein